MKLTWQISRQDIAHVKDFVNGHRRDPFVQTRIKRNLSKRKPPISKAIVWQQMVVCLLTTQQRSGPDSAIQRFERTKPFPLRLDVCSRQSDVAAFVTRTLTNFRGIRRTSVIGRELSTNLERLNEGNWELLNAHLETIRKNSTPATEREAAHFIDDRLLGFGPKQSRNLLQGLGLSRFEIPLDSRTTNWLNEFGFPVKLNAGSLQDREFYEFVSDGFQQLCKVSGMMPCVLDAAIFASFDGATTRKSIA